MGRARTHRSARAAENFAKLTHAHAQLRRSAILLQTPGREETSLPRSAAGSRAGLSSRMQGLQPGLLSCGASGGRQEGNRRRQSELRCDQRLSEQLRTWAHCLPRCPSPELARGSWKRHPATSYPYHCPQPAQLNKELCQTRAKAPACRRLGFAGLGLLSEVFKDK